MSVSARDQSGVPYGFCRCGCGQRTSIALQSHTKQGWVRGEPVPYAQGHNRYTKPKDYLPEDRGYTSPCWIWQQGLHQGYGRTFKDGKRILAHRYVYEQHNGPIGDLHLDHLCRVKACVNPDHLEPVTQTENSRRGSNAKLNHRLAAEIRASDEPTGVLARRYGVSKVTIAKVRTGKTWAPEQPPLRLRSFAEDLELARMMRVPPGRERATSPAFVAPVG